MQVYEDQDPDFFVKRVVKVGCSAAARRFVSDIGHWVNRREENRGNRFSVEIAVLKQFLPRTSA